jgi:hypothetical protein
MERFYHINFKIDGGSTGGGGGTISVVFSSINAGAEVKNLTWIVMSLPAAIMSAALRFNSGDITGCSARGSVGSNNHIGGLAGYNEGTSRLLCHRSVTANIQTMGRPCGVY